MLAHLKIAIYYPLDFVLWYRIAQPAIQKKAALSPIARLPYPLPILINSWFPCPLSLVRWKIFSECRHYKCFQGGITISKIGLQRARAILLPLIKICHRIRCFYLHLYTTYSLGNKIIDQTPYCGKNKSNDPIEKRQE